MISRREILAMAGAIPVWSMLRPSAKAEAIGLVLHLWFSRLPDGRDLRRGIGQRLVGQDGFKDVREAFGGDGIHRLGTRLGGVTPATASRRFQQVVA